MAVVLGDGCSSPGGEGTVTVGTWVAENATPGGDTATLDAAAVIDDSACKDARMYFRKWCVQHLTYMVFNGRSASWGRPGVGVAALQR